MLDGPLDEAEATELAAVLKALADPARVRLVSMVACSPTGEICACDLPGALDRAQPTVSHHLSQLVKAGILDREQRGKWAWFRLRPERLASLRVALGEGGTHADVPDRVIPYDDALRHRIVANLAAHDRREHALDERRHAAVAVVLVDSDAVRDGDDPLFPDDWDMASVPGDTAGLDGRMEGVAGGASFLLCRRASGLRAARRAVGTAGGPARRRREPGRRRAARARRGARRLARRVGRARPARRLPDSVRLRDHPGRGLGRR